MTISLVIPFYNEKEILADTAAKCLELQKKLPCLEEIIFVDDGSLDGGAECLFELAVKLVSYPKNKGKGYAVRRGILASAGDVVLYTDCDLAYGLDVVEEAVTMLVDQKADIVCGSRRIAAGGYSAYPPVRRIASAGFAFLVRSTLGLGVSDTQCGFKCLAGEKARALFSSCVTDGFSFDLEVLGRAQKSGMKIVELPVEVQRHGQSKVRIFKDSLHMAREVFAIRRIIKSRRFL